MAWYDDPELAEGARALARNSFLIRFGGGGSDDPLGDYIAKKRAEKNRHAEEARDTHWTVAWGKANASYFRGDEEEDMKRQIKWLLDSGYKLRSITRRRGGLFNETVETLDFDKPPRGLFGFE